MAITEPLSPTFSPSRLRGLLAERRITLEEFARACGLTRDHVGVVLLGKRAPGELARFKMARGLAALGLDSQATDGQ
jgi:transcriptional regulator with XRE-family HTH domain